MPKLPLAALCVLTNLLVSLTGCHAPQDAADSETPARTANQLGQASQRKGAAAAGLNLADGIDVCFRAINKHLGGSTKVSEINSFFSSGKDIDASEDKSKGEATVCSVQYQDPSNLKRLLQTSLNFDTGEFSTPAPVEITVTGGNAVNFKLDDYLIPLANVNAAGVAAFMESQKGSLGGVFSKYAWSGLRLSSPDVFNKAHVLRLDVEGRLASNDVKESGYAEIAVDGKTMVANHLKPS